jgi:AcrR family transcriptional regulator
MDPSAGTTTAADRGAARVDPGQPLRRDAALNRERILTAAAALFAERGLDVALEDIAARAGVGVGTLYRRFPNRESLVVSLFEDRLTSVIALAEEALDADDPWEGFVGFLERSQRLQAADRGLTEAMLDLGDGQERLSCVRSRIGPLVEEMVRRAQAQGTLRPDLCHTDVPLIHLMIANVVTYSASSNPEVWQRLLALVIDGLRTSRTAPSALPTRGLTDDELARGVPEWRRGCPTGRTAPPAAD